MQADNSLAKALAKTATPRVLVSHAAGGGRSMAEIISKNWTPCMAPVCTSDLPSGGHTLPTLPSEAVGIQDAVAARDYWQRHSCESNLYDVGGDEIGKYPMSLSFDSANTHMWTRGRPAPKNLRMPLTVPAKKLGHGYLMLNATAHGPLNPVPGASMEGVGQS